MRLTRKTTSLAAFAGLLLVLSGCSQTPPDTREADTKAIRDIETQWNADFSAKDVDRVNAHYADDAVLLSPGAPSASTADARKALLKELLSDPAGSIKFQTVSVEVAKSGDLAATRGTYQMTMTNPVTRKPVSDHGGYVTVYRKQPDGAWKAISDINVSDVPPTAPPAKTAARKSAPKKKR